MRLFLTLLAILAISSAHACLWDRDTLAEEAKGNLDVVKATIGWFDRYPPHYYEMRLERVTKEITADPQLLDLYDDAGVACSRLGQPTKAIAWMTLKKAILDTLPQDATTAEARYRYLSNTGTFHLIRWITTPVADRNANLSDLRESEKLITAALELNPDAHFGREKFQLMLITWLLDSTVDPERRGDDNFLREDTRVNGGNNRYPDLPRSGGDFTFEEATKGITGLIQLGAAWESVDTFHALQTSLGGEHRNYLATLAALRLQELVQAGGASLQSSQGIRRQIAKGHPTGDIYDAKKITTYFHTARAAAADREKAWLAYQEERYAKGEHPDTHPQFWSAWKEPAFPEIPEPTFGEQMERHHETGILLFIGAVGLLIAAAITAYIISRLRRRRATLVAQ